MIGKTVSHYKILEKLGEGGMGVVYKALDLALDRLVALKLLPPRAVVTDNDRERFTNEARAAAKLSHPHVATVYEFGEADGKTFLAMEFVEGKSLRKKAQEGPLSVAETLRIATEAASGLAAAHERGIIHRDVKCENIMLTPEGTAKIMDFGLAQVHGQSRLWKTGETVGTVSYMSPEQARGEQLDERTDIWSLGVVMYEMLTGKLPFPGEYESAVLYLIIHEQPQPIKTLRDDVPATLLEIISKCLEKDRDRRYGSATELLSDVNGLQKQMEKGIEEPKKKAEEQRFSTERRPVTVLHAAIVAGEADEPDPEALTAGLDECVDGLVSIIKKYEGMTDRVLGDRLMAVFGAPVAHENDPERAVRCAQEMMAYVDRMNEMGMTDLSSSLRLKIGIHSGIVVAGSVGAERGTGYSVVGETVNIAAGITDMTDPGRVNISEDAQKLVADIVVVDAPNVVPVKGRAHDVNVYRLRSLQSGREPGRRAVGKGEFVGRATEIAMFEAALDRVQGKAEARTFVQGEAGVGKSRLKGEVIARAQSRRMPVCEGKCSSFETNTPYFLWNTFLRSMLRVDMECPESELRSRLHEMVKILAIESEEPYLATLLSLRYEEILLEEDEEKRKRIFEATKNLLRSYARRKPSVYLFEDLHWIDRFSEKLLEYILEDEELGPALLVCLYRPEYKRAGDMSRSGERLNLNRLPTVEARELMRLRFGVDHVPDELLSLIEQRSEGNPFFIEEIVKTLVEKGIVRAKKGILEFQSETLEAGIPETLQGVILARIDQLEGRIREILLEASVIGREFSRPVLEQIIQKKVDVAGGLKKLENLELVFEREDAREVEYLFKHYLIQEVAYNTILQKKRKQLHASIARAIEVLYQDRLKEFYEILAFHYEKAEEWEKAADYLSRAGNKARETFTKEESNGFVARTDAAKAMLLQGKGAKSKILIVYRVMFGILMAEWFFGSLYMIGAPFLTYEKITRSEVFASAFIGLLGLFTALYSMFYLYQILRPRAKAFTLFDDRIESIMSNGASFAIPFSDVSFFHFYGSPGQSSRSILSYFKGMWARDMYYSLHAGVKLIAHRLNPTSFGFGTKRGEIHLRKKTGYTFLSLKTFIRPWKFTLSAQRDLSLTPAEPLEFHEQLTTAYEKWQRKLGTELNTRRSARPVPETSSGDKPLLTLEPSYGFLSTFLSLNYNWYLFLIPPAMGLAIITMVLSRRPGISVDGMVSDGKILYPLLVMLVFLLLFLAVVLLSMRKRKLWTRNRYEFYQDRFTFHLVDGTPQEGRVFYEDFANAEALGHLYPRLFKRGDIIISANRILQTHPAMGLAEAAVVLPDIPNPDAAVASIMDIVTRYRATHNTNQDMHHTPV